jgi:integrase
MVAGDGGTFPEFAGRCYPPVTLARTAKPMTAVEKRRLTKRFIDSVKPDQKKGDHVIWDTDLKGYGLRVKPSGAKSYVIWYRTKAGDLRKMGIAQVGALTPDEARSEAGRHLADAVKGGDPAKDRSDARHDRTVEEVCNVYLADGPAANPTKKASSWATDASNIRRHIIPLLGKRRIRTITRDDILEFQADVTKGKSAIDIRRKKLGAGETGGDKVVYSDQIKPRGRAIVEGGPGTARRATSVFCTLLKFAAAKKLISESPARGISLNRPGRVDRHLSPEELAKLGEALQRAEATGTNATAIAALRTLLLTGARKNEILSLQWAQLDLSRGRAYLPDSKTGQKVLVLPAPAVELLSQLTREKERPWVFPAARGKGHLVGLRPILGAVAADAGLKRLRVHDLRHGFASAAVSDGASLYLVGKVLGHVQARTTERYAHLADDPIRAVAESTSRKIASALKGDTSGNVVKIGKERTGSTS